MPLTDLGKGKFQRCVDEVGGKESGSFCSDGYCSPTLRASLPPIWFRIRVNFLEKTKTENPGTDEIASHS
jgi:hypothetical protein